MSEIVKGHLRLVSLDPDDAVSGGLALNNVTVEIVSSRFVLWDYQGKLAVESPAIYWKVRDVESGAESDQWWSAGGAESGLQPAEEGRSLAITGNQKGMVKDCKAMILLASLRKSGYPQEKLATGDISLCDGMVVHIIQEPDKERKGLKDLKEGRTVPVVDKIVSMPGEKKAGAGAGKGSGKAAAKTDTPSAAGDEITGVAIAAIMGVLSEKGPMSRVDLGGAVFGALAKHPHQQKVVASIYQPDFIEKLGPFKVEAGIVSLGG